MVDAGKVLDTKRNCESFLPNIKRALHIWFGEMRSKPTTQQTSTHREGYIVSVFNQFNMFDIQQHKSKHIYINN